jgi:hypothetical protein
VKIKGHHIQDDEENLLQDSRAKHAKAEVKIALEQRPDFPHLSRGLSWNRIESSQTILASC